MVEADSKGLQVEVLLLPQLAHREFAHRQPLAVSRVTFGELANVFPMVATFGDLARLPAELVQSRFDACGKIIYLRPRVVVVELARNLPTRDFEQSRNRIAKRSLAAMTHVQRSGWIRRNEFDVDLS